MLNGLSEMSPILDSLSSHSHFLRRFEGMICLEILIGFTKFALEM